MIYIYTLSDPRTGEIRYVGKTRNLRRRFNAHITRANCGFKYHTPQWIASLRDDGVRPAMEVIEELPDDGDWEGREIHWIGHYRSLGCDLTNTAPGGLGYASYGRLGKPNTEEHKRKCSEARKGVSIQQRDPEGKRAEAVRKAVAERQRKAAEAGVPYSWGKHTDEHKQHMREIGKSAKFQENIRKAALASADARRGKPAKNRGIPHTAEAKAKVSAAKKGIPWSEARWEAHRKRQQAKMAAKEST